MKNEKLNIPDSWEEVRLGEIIELEYGKGLPKNKRERGGQYFVYGSNGVVGKHSKYLIEGPSIIVGRKGAAGAVHLSLNNCWPIDTTYYIKNYHSLNIRFLFFVLKTLHLNVLDKSTAIPGLNRNDAYQKFIPIPPLNEQRRITAKIEELFSALDKGTESLKKAQQQLKLYRQALLKNAFEGKLTEKWREDFVKTHGRASRLPTAEELLEAIKQERQKRYQKELEEWKDAVKKWEEQGKPGRKPPKPKAFKEIKPLTEEELAELPKLPEGWKWVKNNDLLYYVTSGSRDWKKYYSNKGAYFIRTQDIKYNSLNLSNVSFVDLPEYVEGKRSLVEKGDLLMTITGANVGKVAFIQKKLPEAYVSQSVALMKLTNKIVSPYLHLYFQSDSFGKSFIEKLVYGVGRPVLSLENMKEVDVALCSIEEQHQIVSILEENFSVIDKLEEEIEKGLKKAELLRQSILKKAFEGKLVPQDPNDEPASELLKRIKAEKEKYLSEQKQKKKTVKTQNFASPKKKTIKL